MVAPAGHPAGKRDGLPHVRGGERSGVVRADHEGFSWVSGVVLVSSAVRDDRGAEVGVGRRPGGRVGVDLVAGADVLDLVGAVGASTLSREPDERDAAPLGRADLTTVLLGARRDLARDAAATQRVGDPLAARAALLVGQGDQDRAGHGPAAREHTLGDQRHQRAREAEGDAHARVRRTAVVGERVVASATTDRLQPFVARHEDLDDGAGVVVETPRDAEVGLDRHPSVHDVGAALEHGRELGEAAVEQVVADAEALHALDDRAVGDPDRRQLQTAPCLLGGRAGVVDEEAGHGVGRELVELVDGADRGHDVGDTEPAVEALDQLAVVDLERQRGQGKCAERLHHHPHHLHVVVEGQLVAADDVDVGLGELAVATLLRALAAPGRLDLEAPERELEVPGVLQHVAGEGDGEVEVHPQTRVVAGVRRLHPPQDVDLLVDLAALGETVERLDRAGLDVGEAVQLEGVRQGGDHLTLDDAGSQGAARGSR